MIRDVRLSRLQSILFHPFVLSLGLLGLFLVLFGGPPGFRDGAHFYGPLFEYLRQEFSAGRLPLWNPYENIGQPLAANPTTMFFYPGTLLALTLTLLPGVDPTAAYTVFAGSHLFLALVFTYRLARAWGCSREAAAFAALSYTLGGNVLYQWNNVPFLVGAAWFPESLRSADRMLRRKGMRDVATFGWVTAMMILGGEPQAAYNAMICAFVMLCFRTWKHGRFSYRFGRLLLAGGFAFLVSAVQTLPAVELALLSDRTLETHRYGVYWFSVPPWRLLEFFWPNAGGWQFPENARWFSALPGDREIWVPSFYMGLIPGLLAILALPCRNRSPRWRTVKILLIFFVLGGLGNWFFIYPILDRLPGYGMFRYPAKLLTVASLMLALLAARGFDRMQWNTRFRSWTRLALPGYLLPICFVLLIVFFRIDLIPPVPDCVLFGPFRVEQARSGLVFFAFSALIIVILSEGILRTGMSVKFLVVLTAFDLAAANAWMLTTLPRKDVVSPLLAVLEPEPIAPVRIYRFPIWSPEEFRTHSSKNRLVEAADWDRLSLYHRYPLPLRINMMDVRGTLMAKSYHPLAGQLRRELANSERDVFDGVFEKHLARLGVQYVVAPGAAKLDAERLFPNLKTPTDVSFWKIRDPVLREYVSYEPNRLVFDVSLSERETVVLTEQYWPGWRAFDENGMEIPVHSVEEVFRGVDLSAGEHRITMIYDPSVVKIGGVLSLFGIALVSLSIAVRKKRLCT